jgi:hypothetical protein
MIISTFTEFLYKQESQSESQNVQAQDLNQDIVTERDSLIKKVSYIVSSASEGGVQAQIETDDVDFGKPRVKVLINGIEHLFMLEGDELKIEAPDGGTLDNFKGTPEQVVEKLIGFTLKG